MPVKRVGRLVLDRNPDNFFAETEQVAFHPGHLVSGIDFTNDPLLQGRLFSYTDTQLIRLGGPNFHEIPINRPVAPVHNNQRDGHMRQTLDVGQSSYHPNSLGGGCPMQAGRRLGGFVSYPEAHRRGRSSGPAARSSSTTSARRPCSGTASPRRSRGISSRPCASSWARSTAWRSASGCWACSPRSTRIWPDVSRKASGWPCRRGWTAP